MVDIDADQHCLAGVEGQRSDNRSVKGRVLSADLAVDFEQEIVKVSSGHVAKDVRFEALRDDALLLVAAMLHRAVNLRALHAIVT